MKKLIIPIVLLAFMLLVLFMFVRACLAIEETNLFKPETRVSVDSEIDPWDLFFIKENGKVGCKWTITNILPCPQGDVADTHMVITNPDLEAEIDKIEIVISQGGFFPFGTLISYSYMKDDEWHLFYYDFNKNRYVKHVGKHGHGGSIFDKNKKRKE